MYGNSAYNDEYGSPSGEGYGAPAAASVPEEFPAPAPEFTPVGLRSQRAAESARRRKRKYRRAVYGLFAAALVLTSVGPFRLFRSEGNAASEGQAGTTAGQQQADSPQSGTQSGGKQSVGLFGSKTGGDAEPVEPSFTATVTGALEEGSPWLQIDYRAEFRPAEGDPADYDFEIERFGMHLYDAGGEQCGGTYITASGIPDVAGEHGAYVFTYAGPAVGDFTEDTAKFTVFMVVTDRSSGRQYEVETGQTAVPEALALVPECDLYVTAFYSEFRGKAIFRNTETVTHVDLEIWDPETDSLERTLDITEAALEDGAYDLAEFTSDFIYDNHAEYYDEQGSFPMRILVKVIVQYASNYVPDGEITFSAESMNEVGWHAEYIPLDAVAYSDWMNPGCFQVQVKDCPVAYEIDYCKGEPESPNYVFVQMQVDGESVRIDPTKLVTKHAEYDASTFENGEWIDHHFHTTLLVIPMPEGCAEGGGHTATITVTQYLTSAKAAVPFKVEIEF